MRTCIGVKSTLETLTPQEGEVPCFISISSGLHTSLGGSHKGGLVVDNIG